MTRFQSALTFDQMAGTDDRPRRRKPTTRERWLAQQRREEAVLRAARELRAERRRARDREEDLEPVTGASRAVDPWGPAVRLGSRMRVQAVRGHRAAVIELKPGLFLVAEIPEEAAQAEFGFLPLLAPMIIRAASNTIGPMVQHSREARAARDAQPGGAAPQNGHAPFRMFAARPRGQASASPAPLALPGPVASPAGPGTIYLPAPNVGWVDDALVADVMGCDACHWTCGR